MLMAYALVASGSVPRTRCNCHSRGQDEVLPLIVGPSNKMG